MVNERTPMALRDGSLWPPDGETPDGADSIAGELASRFDTVSPSPGDAMDWAAIAARYEREAVALGAGARASELLYEAGRIYEERLSDPDAALGFHRRGIDAEPLFLPNIHAARRLALLRGDRAFAAEALAVEAERAGDPSEGAALLRLRGRVLLELGREPEAREAMAQADALTPGSVGSAEEAVRAAAAAGDRVALLDAFLQAAAACPEPRAAAHHLLAASLLAAEGLGDLDRAAALAADAFARCPEDPLVRATARLHAERTGDLVTLAEILRADADAASGPAAARALLDLARAEERLGNGDRAVAALERAWTAVPDDTRVLGELARLGEARREWLAASDALEALAAAHAARPDPGHFLEAIAARLRRVELEEVELHRVDEAIRCCRKVLELDPAQRTALASLGRLCARAGDWEGVLQAFRAEAASVREPRERAQRTFKAAQVLEERLARPAEAITEYREALLAEPGFLAARSALEGLLEREGRWDELCALVEDELAAAAPAEQVEALFRLARLEEERRGDLAAAVRCYRRILEPGLDPDNRGARRGLRNALERQGDGAGLAEALASEAAHAADPARRAALLQRRAEVLDEAGAPEALAAWEAVRGLAPDHLPALRALGRLHAGAGSWEEVAALFRAQADVAADPSQAAELLLRAADLAERRLGRPEQALAGYREVLTLAPAHLPALHALARLHRGRGEHEALSEVLRAQAAAREAPSERAAVLTELGQLCEERLRDRERAVEAYEEALRADPAHAPALRALERLYLDQGNTQALAGLRRAALLEPADPAAEALPDRLLRLAWLEADRVGDAGAALRAAERLAELVPGSPAPEPLFLRFAADPARRAAALAALFPPAAPPPGAPANEDAARALDATRRSQGSTEPGARAAFALEAGEAWERAGEPERALAAYQTALTAVPAHLPALRAARTLFASRRDWGAVRATLQAEGGALQTADEAAAAWREAGAIAEQWFGDVEGAVEDYRRALQRDPRDPVALTRVEALLVERGPLRLAEVHAARAEAERDPDRAAEAWLAAARASLGVPEGRAAARTQLDAALALRDDLAPALVLRARLRAEAGEAAQALSDLERSLALGGQPATQVPLHLAAAALCQDVLADASGALHHAEAALALAPDRDEALARVARLHRDAGRLGPAAASLRRLTEVPGLPREAQLQHGFDLAELEAALGEVDHALGSCRRVLDQDPGHPGALRLVVELERRCGDPQALAAALEAASSHARDAAFRGDAHLEAARLHAGPLGSRLQAVEHLRAALELDPSREDVRATLADVAEETLPALALDQHRRLLARDPLRVASWSALYRILERTRTHDGAFVAASVLRWLSVPSPAPAAERLLLEADRQTLTPPPALTATDLGLVFAPGDRGPLADVVAGAGDVLAGVFTDPRETRGAPVREDHPFRRTLTELARALGAGAFELYAAPLGRLTVEPGDPAAVRVGADLAHRSTLREQRFLLGRAAARLRTRSGLLEAFPDGAAAALTAVVQQFVPHYGGLGRPDDELVRRVGKALTRKARRALEEPARALASQRPPPDLAAWRAAAAATADRAGLILCGDVPTAVELLVRDETGKRPAPEDRVARVRACPAALALLTFAATEAHLTLRQRLRVAIA